MMDEKYKGLLTDLTLESLSTEVSLQVTRARQIWPNMGKLVGRVALFTRYKADFSGSIFTNLYIQLVEAEERQLAKAVIQAASITCGLILDTSLDDHVFRSNKLIRNNIGEDKSLQYIDYLLNIDGSSSPVIGANGAPLKLFLKLLVSETGNITLKQVKVKKPASGGTAEDIVPNSVDSSGSNIFAAIDQLVKDVPEDSIKKELLECKELLKDTLTGLQSTNVEFNKVIKGILKTLD